MTQNESPHPVAPPVTEAPKPTSSPKNAEKQIEALLEKVMTHPLFLDSVSVLMNFNSYRRIAFRKSISHLWKNLELPNKHDQEKTLFLVNELQFRLHKLERELAKLGRQQESISAEETTPAIHFESSPLKKKTVIRTRPRSM